MKKEEDCSMDRTVYAVQIPSRLSDGMWIPTIDLLPAAAFGAIEVIFPAGMQFHTCTPEVILRLNERLKKFRPDEDSLLPMGDPVLMMATAAHLARRFETVWALKWDKKRKMYVQYHF